MRRRRLIFLVAALCACAETDSEAPIGGAQPSPLGPPPAPNGDKRAVERDRGLHAARGAPVHEQPWDGPWRPAVYSPNPDDPGARTLALALGVTAQPAAAFQPPPPGVVAVVWLAAEADYRQRPERSGGGSLVFAVAPGPPAWRDGATVALGFAGGGLVDSVASARRWIDASPRLDAAAAGGAAAWEVATHYNLRRTPVEVGAPGLLATVLGSGGAATPAGRAWLARVSLPVLSALSDPDAAVRLGAIGRASKSLLVPLASDSEPLVRAQAVDRLTDIGALRTGLDDTSSVVRLVAGNSLARLARDGVHSEPLRAALEHAANKPDAYLRWKAAHGLGYLPGSVASLTPMLTDLDVDVRREAARALGRQGDPAAIPALEAALSDPNSFVRQWVARGLAGLAHPDALPGLRRAANDPTTLVAEVGAQGARQQGEELPLEHYRPPRPGDPAALLALLAGPDGTARKDALKLLAGTPDGTQAAIGALNDPDSEVRKQAVESLGWGDRPQPEVLDVLDDPDPDVLVTALIALRRRPVPGSADAIAATLSFADPEVRLRAAQALATLARDNPGGAAAAALVPVLTDPDERTRAAAVSVWPERLADDEPAALVRRAAASQGGSPCSAQAPDVLVHSACPDRSADDGAAGRGLMLMEDELLHLRASWTSPTDRPTSHSALRPPVFRPYGDPDRG